MKDIKRHLIRLFFSVLIVILSCDTKQQFVSLSILKPTIIEENGAEIFQYWEFNNSSLLWNTNFIDPFNLKLYKDSLNSLLGSDTTQSIIQKMSEQDILYKSVNTQNGDSINTQLIHSKVLGKIRPINYLEAQILEYQMNRYPLLSHPTEFHGFILLNDSLNIVRVYFAASDQPWPPKPNVILSAVKNDLKTGWTFNYHLHNHYEPKANRYLGILAPSMTDAQYYLFLSEEYNLKHAIITNGFHTVEIQREEFHKLKSPESN
ncbi:MAG: hypothetical protein ABI851_15045 [Saprospiraceae bacterium]